MKEIIEARSRQAMSHGKEFGFYPELDRKSLKGSEQNEYDLLLIF